MELDYPLQRPCLQSMHVLEASVSNCAAIHPCDTVQTELNLTYFDITIDNTVHYYSCNYTENFSSIRLHNFSFVYTL
jgi:hypothetical protein